MTADQRFTLLISALALLFIVMSGILATIWRTGNRWGMLSQQVSEIINNVAKVANNLDTHIQWHIDRNRR